MKYQVNLQHGRLTIDRMSIGKARITLAVVGGIFLIVALGGFWGIYSANNPNDPSLENYLLAIIIGSLGSLGFLVARLFAGKVLRAYPEKVVFNNQEAAVEIYHQASVAKKVSVPYQEISGFEVRDYQANPRHDKSLFQDRFYSIVMRLKDGTIWELTDGSKDSRYAEDDLEKILQHTSLGNIHQNSSAIQQLQSSHLNLQLRGDELKVGWKNRLPQSHLTWTVISLILMSIAAFAAHIIISIAAEEEGRTWEVILKSLSVEFNQMSAERLLEILGGPLAFAVFFFLLMTLMLIINVVISIFHKMKNNSIILTNSFFSSTNPKLNMHAKEIGNIHFKYYLDSSDRVINIDKEKIEHEPLISEMPDLSQVDDFVSFTKMSFKFFRSSLKEFASGDFERRQRAKEAKMISEFNLAKHSPIDVLAVYMGIKRKLNLQNKI